jgi:hypothetical protein
MSSHLHIVCGCILTTIAELNDCCRLYGPPNLKQTIWLMYQLSVAVKKITELSKRRKDLFWLMVS